MSQVIDNNAIPSAIKEKLQSIRIRAGVVAAVRAVAIAVTVLLVAMVVVMAIDWWFMILSTSIRTALTAGTFCVAVAGLLLFSIRPISSALRWNTAAGNVDKKIPQMQERWMTVANSKTGMQQASKIEQAMLQQVTSEAVVMGSLVEPKEIVRPASLKRPAVWFGAALALFALFMVSNWGQTSVLLARFLHPTQMITATQLESVTGDLIVPRGESVELVTAMSGLQRETGLFMMEGESFISEQQELSSGTDRPEAFVCSVDVDETFRYRMKAGDGTTKWHTVTAIDFPTLEDVQLTVTAPTYIRQEPVQKSLIPGRLRVFQGSTLKLAMKPDAPLKEFELILTMGSTTTRTETDELVEETLVITADDDGWYRFEAPLMEDFSFYPKFVNVHDLKNERSRICRVHVIKDQAPVARIISPTDEMAVGADDEIEVKFEAHDDHGISKAELIVYDDANTKEGEDPKILAVMEIPLDDQMLKKHVMGKLKLDLKEFGLEEGASISYSIRVTDNREMDADTRPLDKESMVASNDGQNDDGPKPNNGNSEQDSDAKNDADGKHESQPKGSSSDNTKRKPKDGSDNSDEMMASVEDADTRSSEASPKDSSAEPGARQDEGDSPYVRDPSKADVAKGEQPESKIGTDSQSDSEKLIASNQPPSDSSPESGQPSKKDSDTSNDDATNETVNSPASKSKDGDPSAESRKRLLVGSDKESSDQELNEATVAEAKVKDGTEGELTNANNQPGKDHADLSKVLADNDNPSKESGEKTTMPDTDAERSEDGNSGRQQNGANDKRVAANNESKSQANANSKSSRSSSGSMSQNTKNGQRTRRNTSRNPFPRLMQMTAQSNANQRQRNNRRRLNITERFAAVAEKSGMKALNSRPREIVLEIDKQLARIEKGLTMLVNKAVADDERSDRYTDLDLQTGEVEALVDQLHQETTDTQFAFVGLQMVDISRTHITPARDGVFVAIRQPDLAADTYARESLHHITSARELLDALLKKYDRVARDQKLASDLEETLTMYEVYVEKAHQLMSASRQNKDPLKMRRKMAVVEVDQAYLDRYAEVATLRREMMAEFGRMLTDDPRLLARYMDLIKRRGDSLRVRLRELAEQQAQLQDDVVQWAQVDEDDRIDLWAYFAELRLLQAGDLSRDAQSVAERIQKQMPLSLDASRGSAALVIEHSRNTALLARECQRDAKKMLKVLGDPDAAFNLRSNAQLVANQVSELMAALDQLNFESGDNEGVTAYVDSRLIETRTLSNQIDSWLEEVGAIEDANYSKLALINQQEVSIATELLRVDMLAIEDGLGTLFRELPVPQEARNYARDLNRVMESITFNQMAAGFAISTKGYEKATAQHKLALAGFERAEELIDKLRRRTAEIIDEKQEVQDPTIDQLRDPTLDEFLQRLEREPNLAARLGLPRRPRNLRVIQQTMMWQQNAGNMIGQSQNQAAQRARRQQMAELKRKGQAKNKDKPEQREMTKQEQKDLEEAKDMQAMIQNKMKETLKQMQAKAQEKDLTPEERKRLEEAQEKIQKRLKQMQDGGIPDDAWDQLVESQQMDEVLKAMQNKGRIPDSVWNKLQSTLDHGLWQVGSREPSEDYRQRIQDYLESIDRLTTSGIEDAE